MHHKIGVDLEKCINDMLNNNYRPLCIFTSVRMQTEDDWDFYIKWHWYDNFDKVKELITKLRAEGRIIQYNILNDYWVSVYAPRS